MAKRDRQSGNERTTAVTPEKRGRPSKLNHTLTQRLCSAIARGNSITTAAKLCRLSPSVVYHWRNRGEEEQTGLHREFLEALSHAQGVAEDKVASALFELAIGRRRADYSQLRACVEWLQRRDPNEWGRIERPLPPSPSNEQPFKVSFVIKQADGKGIETESLDEAWKLIGAAPFPVVDLNASDDQRTEDEATEDVEDAQMSYYEMQEKGLL
jgi:hypothetical protein